MCMLYVCVWWVVYVCAPVWCLGVNVCVGGMCVECVGGGSWCVWVGGVCVCVPGWCLGVNVCGWCVCQGVVCVCVCAWVVSGCECVWVVCVSGGGVCVCVVCVSAVPMQRTKHGQ